MTSNSNEKQDGRERRLSSWKEIAAFLQVSVRTAQKWEAERGLPVHRLPGPRGPVFACLGELEGWLRSAEGAAVEADPRDYPLKELRNSAAGSASSDAKRRIRLWAGAAAIFLGAAAIAAYALLGRSGVPVSSRVEGRDLIVIDAKGRQVWRHTFHRELERTAYDSVNNLTPPSVWIGDLDADGEMETLFAATWRDRIESGVLYCFSQGGEKRWQYRPGGRVRSGGGEFTDHYNPAGMYIIPPGRGLPDAILFVATHNIDYPCQVSLISAGGERMRQYWHSGHVGNVLRSVGIADLDGDGINEFYLGGESNATKCATLVALRADQFEGASAEDNPDYQIQDMKSGMELFRIFFPRGCVSQEIDFPGHVRELRIEGNSLVLQAEHGFGDLGDSLGYRILPYPEVRVTGFSFSSKSSVRHALLRAQGRLNHDFDRDREEWEFRKIEIKRPSPGDPH